MFLLVILLIVLYFYKTGELQQWVDKPIRNANQEDNAKRILDTRLAKGEISIEEYQKLRSIL